MPYDTPSTEAVTKELTQWMSSLSEPEHQPRKRGRPSSLPGWQVSLAVLLCLWQGLRSQLEVWRLIAFFGVGPFAPIAVSDQTVYNYLEQTGVQGFMQCFAALSNWLRKRLAPYEERRLAPFATAVLALDESVLDKVKRSVAWLREVPKGDSRLLPGRIAALFDVRLQQWVRVDVLLDATANCKRHAREMLRGLLTGTLLLFDRGYFAFPWLDELSEAGYYYISRTVGKTRYPLLHIFIMTQEVFDALVYLGSYRADRAAQPVRLVRVRVSGTWYSYLTNVTDPTQLSVADIVRLYQRRWDIELAFRLLKDHLGLRLVWSAKLGVIYQQVWACLLLCQLVLGLQGEIAARAEVEPFDVSVDLLVRYAPRLVARGDDLIEAVLKEGRAMGIIRPSTRLVAIVPSVPLWHYHPAPADVLQPQSARSAHRTCHSRYASS
jgi:Transposase DDE domain